LDTLFYEYKYWGYSVTHFWSYNVFVYYIPTHGIIWYVVKTKNLLENISI